MSFQFYPTPAKTAALMWSKFKRAIGVVCDPSAGQGHLIRHAREGFAGVPEEGLPWMAELLTGSETERGLMRKHGRMKFAGSRYDRGQFLAVEIDPQHHAGLRELGGKVLGYDFLQVQSLAAADQIIMNPPFADGAKHVLHAWKVLHDGEIVAILNAETIRNPFSQERRSLVELLDKHGSVEFLQDQFLGDDVERKTPVEVALIYLEKKSETAFDLGLDGLKRRSGQEQEIDPAICQALALPENFVENIYHRFTAAVDAARKAAEYGAMFDAASASLGITLTQMQAKGVGGDFRDTKTHAEIKAEANRAFRKSYQDLQQRAWAQIIRSSLLTEKLSNQARRKVESEAQAIYELEFSIPNVHGFLAGVIASMGDIYAEMICGLFDTIIQRSTDNVAFYKSWKSNERHKFGMRIKRTRFIIPGFKASWGGRGLDYESERFLADIDKVFGYLHGVSDKYNGLVDAFDKGLHLDSGRVSTRFFEFRYYKGTQTIHFYPKDVEVVEKLNRFVGAHRKWLPQQMDEANADFQKQYEQAEKLSGQYDKRWKGTPECRASGWYDNRVYAMTVERPTEDHYQVMQAMVNCIEQEHDAMGLHCGPALKHEAAPQALSITHAPAEQKPTAPAQADAHGQLSLLAA